MDCSPPGSSVHGILQARMLEWVAIPFSRASSWPWDQTQVCNAGRFFIRLSHQWSPGIPDLGPHNVDTWLWCFCNTIQGQTACYHLRAGIYAHLHRILSRTPGFLSSWGFAKFEGYWQGEWVSKFRPKTFDDLLYLLGQKYPILVYQLPHQKAAHLKSHLSFAPLTTGAKIQLIRIYKFQQWALWVIHWT